MNIQMKPFEKTMFALRVLRLWYNLKNFTRVYTYATNSIMIYFPENINPWDVNGALIIKNFSLSLKYVGFFR